MARVDGKCLKCDAEGWVDALTTLCRECELKENKRWGHRDVKAEPVNKT